jgi:transcriptional regulator with XRE-family HTH domain
MGKKKRGEGPPQREEGQGAGLVSQIRQALAATGQSLGQLEGRCGVDRSSLSRFMRGKQDLKGSLLEKIATALGLRLVGGEEKAAARTKGKGRKAKGE